jgi:alkylation response protein AidB-like acyl-CoA dehydrogenase
MNFEPSESQKMISETFARFLDEQSSIPRVRASAEQAFDASLWAGLAEMGTFAIRVPEPAGGLRRSMI